MKIGDRLKVEKRFGTIVKIERVMDSEYAIVEFPMPVIRGGMRKRFLQEPTAPERARVRISANPQV